MKRVLVTGAAGFIGFHVARRLHKDGLTVLGVDNYSDYYSVQLKRDRVELLALEDISVEEADLADPARCVNVLESFSPDSIVHLAAQPGVRYSLENPRAYVAANISAFVNVLEGARNLGTGHLVYASSSSVYGLTSKTPFAVGDPVDHPVSLYAATKVADEVIAHAYAHLFALPITGLRFFTVYGPWGRPDMAVWKFTEAALEDRPIDLFNFGEMKRDFTFIDDIVEGVVRVLENPPQSGGSAPHRLYNIGNSDPVALADFVSTLEAVIGKPIERNLLPMQPGDVLATAADVSALQRDVGFRPETPLETGLQRFVEWYRSYKAG